MVPRRIGKTWIVDTNYILNKYDFDRDMRNLVKKTNTKNATIYESKVVDNHKDPKIKLEILYQKAVKLGALK